MTLFVGSVASSPSPTALTLLEIRKRLVKESGHYELVVDTGEWADNGANQLIADGQRWLETRMQSPKEDYWLFKVLSDKQGLVTFNMARTIKEVWLASTSSGRVRLEKKLPSDLRKVYADVPLSELTTGKPLYWAPIFVGLAPEIDDQTKSDLETAGMTDLDFISFGSHHLLSGIMLMPPSDGVYTLELRASFYSTKLNEDTDVNFWTLMWPSLLVRAARLQMEIDLHRNTEGRKDFEAPLEREIMMISAQFVAETQEGPPEMFVMGG